MIGNVEKEEELGVKEQIGCQMVQEATLIRTFSYESAFAPRQCEQSNAFAQARFWRFLSSIAAVRAFAQPRLRAKLFGM